ncbi:hypothetical protein A3B18_00340 [Candidatus Giovannonibacteria bacterium RIFCSPLOWO2_01_FULL_46_13]|uniref:Uncharacterized protein n=1 Tax=Candidatus Giovannonibacteria bacterium RIFCSPLOWO2_01_FULL_46_13 TaxID=1798352 RepID=A0A1F5X4D6_9BACT|nr:MAG: hypothetical protein A3B18_00340 [Candidatus Giovannonibacteria bacterium RIFCSPLOWO2_01_FULL_46_13]
MVSHNVPKIMAIWLGILIVALGILWFLDAVSIDFQDGWDYSTPTEKLSINDISNWKTYRNEEFGFEVKYLSTYSNGNQQMNFTAGTESESVLGRYNEFIGLKVGPLVFVVLNNDELLERGRDYLRHYLEIADGVEESEWVGCSRLPIPNTSVQVEVVECDGEGGLAGYGIIKGGKYEIFIQHYPNFIENVTEETLATFKFTK